MNMYLCVPRSPNTDTQGTLRQPEVNSVSAQSTKLSRVCVCVHTAQFNCMYLMQLKMLQAAVILAKVNLETYK